MAANETEMSTKKLKTQSFGRSRAAARRSPRIYIKSCSGDDNFLYDYQSVARLLPPAALQEYKKARENGEQQDNPKPFPSAGFENLKIKTSTYKPDGPQGEDYWPDASGRYWWRLTLEDDSVREDFYWTQDKARGYPDKNDSDRYWFIVHGPDGVRIEGFSWEADRKKGFPDSDDGYWRYVQYTECGLIKEWMEQKDQNYRVRTGTFSFSVPFKLNTAKEVKISEGLISNNFCCPITQEIMWDPVSAMDGHTYEREAILQALDKSMLSPMTGQPMESKSVVPNHSMRSMIRDFLTQHPECWQEVYVANGVVNELLSLSSRAVSLDLQKWGDILRVDPRLLTLPLQGVTLLEFLCKQNESIIKIYLSALLNLLTPKDWQDLIRIYSAQDWLKLVAHTCERCVASELATEFLNKLQAGLGIKEINPLEMALYALEQQHIGLFKLALSQIKDVNVLVDEDKNTLLHLAARQGQTEMVQCLLNRGAHLKQRNAPGLKAESVARLAGFEATADQIAVFKLTPVLERMGFFTGLQRLEVLEKEMQQIKASSGPSGYAKI